MIRDPLLASLAPWLSHELGVDIARCGRAPIPIFAESAPRGPLGATGFLGFRFPGGLDDDRAVAALVVRSEWVEPLGRATDGLSLDEVFSIFGAYEIGRVTMTEQVGVFGPAWAYVGDSESFRDIPDARVVQLTPAEMRELADPRIFWHAWLEEAVAGFAILDEEGCLAALAGVKVESDRLLEIGMDTHPDSKLRGLGGAVVAAAGRWILGQRMWIYYTTSAWNPPSARTARRVGLRHLWDLLVGIDGWFPIPPQPLGSPRPGALIQDYYPRWAMNQEIRPRDDS